MRNVIALTLCGMLTTCVGVNVALGRPDYRKQFEERYKTTKIAAALKKEGCRVCHYGKSKTNRNDYGTALSKLLTAESYLQLKSKPEELNKKIGEALKKVSGEKSKSGKTFGELIEAGSLPGTAPAGAQ